MENSLRIYLCEDLKMPWKIPPGTLGTSNTTLFPFSDVTLDLESHTRPWHPNFPKEKDFRSPSSNWFEVSICQDQQCLKTRLLTVLLAGDSLLYTLELNFLWWKCLYAGARARILDSCVHVCVEMCMHNIKLMF